MKAFFVFSFFSLVANIIYAQGFSKAEYFIDTDPGIDNGIVITANNSSDIINFTASVPTASLAAGFHTLGLRVKHKDGNWGLFEKRGFYVSTGVNDAPNIVSAEYFFDTDPGVGNGTPASVGATGGVVNFTAVIPTSLSEGFHFLAIRTRDASGTWGLFEKRGFYVSTGATDAPNIVSAEYFFDTDPGVGNGTPASVGATGGVVNFTAVIPTSLSEGFHFLAIRTRDASGIWGLFEKRGFYVSKATADMPIVSDSEYFFDTDPGVGNGTALTINTPGNIINQTFTIPVPGGFTDGEHILAIRVKDQNGNWGLYEFKPFTVSGTVPVTGMEFFAIEDRQKVQLHWYTMTETNTSHYEIERGSDGMNFKNIGKVTAAGHSNNRTDYYFTDEQPQPDVNYYRLKQTDLDGVFVYSEIRVVEIKSSGNILVYPTLTSGSVQINGLEKPSVIKIFNNTGQMVASYKMLQMKGTIHLQNISKGNYWLTIEQEGKLVHTSKIIKQ